MHYLTKQERFLLLLIGSVILSGSIIHFVFVKFPQLKDGVHLLESHALYEKIDINTASREDFLNLPYIGEITSHQIIAYRNKHGRFSSVDELKKVEGIKQKNFERFKMYLKCKRGK